MPTMPTVTHLQFLVLGLLLDDEQPGRVIRQVLARYGVKPSGPAFYQMMARLERDGLAEGRYEQITVGDQAVTERRYRITAAGAARWKKARAFYERVGQAARHTKWSDA